MVAPRPASRSVSPAFAVEGGRVTIEGEGLPFHEDRAPAILVGDSVARVVASSTRRLRLAIPPGVAGSAEITTPEWSEPLASVEVAQPLARGLHIVDSPVFDAEGNVYATFSGTRGQRVPVSVYRVRPGGEREDMTAGIVNATSLAFDRAGILYVSSRFDGAVYRLKDDGRADKVASDLGAACGMAFGPDGALFVGDRSGTLFRVNAAGRGMPFATLPPSVAAFHVAVGPEEDLYVAAPTLSSSDVIYRVDRRGTVSVFAEGFGRPQGVAFDRAGRLHVVEALAAASGVYRVWPGGRRQLMVSGDGLVGLAFHPRRGFVVASNDTIFRFDRDLP